MLTQNCRNCGAPHFGNCDYCGTQYMEEVLKPTNCAGRRIPLDYATANSTYIQASQQITNSFWGNLLAAGAFALPYSR